MSGRKVQSLSISVGAGEMGAYTSMAVKSKMEMFERYTFEAPVKKPAKCPHFSARGSSARSCRSVVHCMAYHIFSIAASSFLLDIPEQNGPCSSPMYLLVCARNKRAAESIVMEIK